MNMPDIKTKNNLGNFSDINDEIIIKEDDDFQVFSHGNLSDLDLSRFKKKKEFSKSKELLDTGKEEINLAPPAPVVWNQKASFYFDVQDEDDIAKEVKKIEKMKKKPTDLIGEREVRKYSLAKILKKLLENYNLDLLPELEKRLANIVLSFLKHTRTKVDVLNLFKAPINQSGLALKDDASNRLIDLLDNIKSKIDEVGGVIIEDQKYNQVTEVQKNKQTINNLANTDPRQQIKAEIKKSSIPVVKRMQVSRNKPIVTGIKNKEKVVSPVDEFSEITLLAFKRLSQDPIEATQKIMDKIRSLEKESYLKRATAIQNWRKSEVYSLYLDLGKESMEKNLSIDRIIEQKILAKEKVLTKKEFSAITDLNKKLRF
jgi:hypothetical protein